MNTEFHNNSDSIASSLTSCQQVTTAPKAKPRTIRSMSNVGRKPIPPVRKHSILSLVNIRSNQPVRQPINVIIDLNNSLWRNIRIQDMDKYLMSGDYSMAIDKHQPSTVNASESNRDRSHAENRKECENDQISVHMEDITHSGTTVHDEYASSCNEIDEVNFNPDQTVMRMGPEWVVPKEYSSSPIVQELAESCEERPKPPVISQYAGSLTASISNAKIPQQEKKVSILEQIVRSHPIWYLQHIRRPTATHLLRPMEPGNFIVRASSKPGSMAMSVRLSNKHDGIVEHYIVEYNATRTAIRLESSSHSFRSLPLLIEHYCLHSEELQVCLRLPTAIMLCKTTKELQSVALMGQGELMVSLWNLVKYSSTIDVLDSIIFNNCLR
ncbi:SH2 domain protein [Dictyocaulus viviparus]|uniref:SH2 domain protein n=1 Tax=Dictyocaulus viviparus TaxID=29172 RepID=A0A0D8Y4P0_DICVI|nr:SH2 domain protein [Dictyocaulus viviparus]